MYIFLQSLQAYERSAVIQISHIGSSLVWMVRVPLGQYIPKSINAQWIYTVFYWRIHIDKDWKPKVKHHITKYARLHGWDPKSKNSPGWIVRNPKQQSGLEYMFLMIFHVYTCIYMNSTGLPIHAVLQILVYYWVSTSEEINGCVKNEHKATHEVDNPPKRESGKQIWSQMPCVRKNTTAWRIIFWQEQPR